MSRDDFDALSDIPVLPIIALITLLVMIVALLGVLPSVLMDLWWYEDVDFTTVFFTRVWARWALFGLATAGCFAVLFAGITISDRQSRDAPKRYAASRTAMDLPPLRGLPMKILAVLISLGFGFVISTSGVAASVSNGQRRK